MKIYNSGNEANLRVQGRLPWGRNFKLKYERRLGITQVSIKICEGIGSKQKEWHAKRLCVEIDLVYIIKVSKE